MKNIMLAANKIAVRAGKRRVNSLCAIRELKGIFLLPVEN